MEVLQEAKDVTNNSFVSHVFSTTEEDKGEILNVIQYSLMGVIPVVIMNKLIQRFIPEADPEKSSLELLAEIAIQLVVIFGSLIFIHRMITFVPSYSGFKYERLTLTNVVLAFLVIVLSIQSKIGIKTNILVDRVYEMWNGPEVHEKDAKSGVRVRQAVARHAPSQADHLDNGAVQNDMFPPAPTATQSHQQLGNHYTGGAVEPVGPVAANGLLGGAFGASF
ncbi:MAG: hypothetical protein ACOVRN_02995 [Flavobacterium sp.]